MLEELQRLQAHIGALKSRLDHYEHENQALVDAKEISALQYQTQVEQKNSIQLQKQQEIEVLTEQAAQTDKQLKQMTHDAAALADRYNRLEKSCNDLKTRFQEILLERNNLRAITEKLENDQRLHEQEVHGFQQERERLLQKNELAQTKVEAIIQRLSILGGPQDQNAQEIQQLAHPTQNNDEV